MICEIVTRKHLLNACHTCRTFEKQHQYWKLNAPDVLWAWENEVARILHEYEVHSVPHREITGRDNYFTSISEVSRFTNPEFTKAIKAIVKGRAGFRCECCGRNWTDVTSPNEETLYFKQLENLWSQELAAKGFRLSELGRFTFTEYAVDVGLNRCRNCGTVLQIEARWWTEEPKRIRPSRWFQVHHKNLQHFDNRLENLEYLCGNCHRAKGRWDVTKRENIWNGGIKYAHGLIEHMRSRGIEISYIFLSKMGRFSWAVIGERQD